jgi:hypothetical protein
MNKSLLFFVFLTLIANVLSAQLTFAPSANQVLAEQHRARFHAMTTADTALLATYLDPALRYVHSNGLNENYREHLINVAAGKIKYELFREEQQPDIKLWDQTGLVQGRLEVSGLYEGTPFEVTLWYLAVYRLEGNRWKLVSWQSTKGY